MPLKSLIIAVFSALLNLCLWGATFVHGGLIVWDRLYLIDLPKGYQIPTRWADLLGLGATDLTFGAYLGVLALNMVWEVATREKALPNPLSTYKAGSGDTALFLWALGDGLAHYALAERWITAMPLYLDQTLAACALLWMAQKLVGMFLRRSQSLPLTSNPTLLTRPEPLDVLVVARPKGVERAPNFGRDAPPSPLSNITLPSDPITTKATTPPASSRRKTGPKPAKEELEKKLMDFIQLKGQAQTGDLVVALGAARRTINRCLDKLLSEGRLERQGKARAAVYRVKESPKNEVVEEEKGQP